MGQKFIFVAEARSRVGKAAFPLGTVLILILIGYAIFLHIGDNTPYELVSGKVVDSKDRNYGSGAKHYLVVLIEEKKEILVTLPPHKPLLIGVKVNLRKTIPEVSKIPIYKFQSYAN